MSGSAVSRLTDATPAATRSPAKPKKAAPPVITLTGDAAATFDRYASADAVCKVAGTGQADALAKVKAAAWLGFLQLCIAEGSAVANPRLSTGQSKASFQVKHVSSFTDEFDEDNNPIPVKTLLEEAGFPEDLAAAIVAKALTTTKGTRIKSLTEMASSNDPKQRAVAERIAKYVEKWLTPEDRALMLEGTETTTVNECWKDVAVSAAVSFGGEDLDGGVDALRRLFEVIPVSLTVSGATYTGPLELALTRMLPAVPAAGTAAV